MLCQDCKKREATIHLTKIVNNKKMTVSVCDECAAARGFSSPLDSGPFPLAKILSGLAHHAVTDKQKDAVADLKCKKCGTTFEEFTRKGRFGCGECYTTFRPHLELIMRRIHGASLHRGRQPETVAVTDQSTPPVKEEARLEQELRKAIADEDYERAAEIRDKLRTIRDSVSVDS